MNKSKFEIRKAENGQYYFVLIASNGEIVLQSETYHNLKDAQDTIESIKAHAPKAVTHIAFK